MADLNGDGRDDIVSGSYPGELYVLLREEDGAFSPPQKLLDREGNPIKVGRASAVAAADWDGDGDLDLIVGNIDGKVFLVPNDGSAREAAFGAPKPLEAAGHAVLAPGGDAGPCVADWDGDGRLDLLLGSGSGAVLFYRNTGSREAAELAAPAFLVEMAARDRSGDDRPGLRTKVCATDWNGDGLPDLLVGDLSRGGPADRKAHGYVWVLLRKPGEARPAERSGGR